MVVQKTECGQLELVRQSVVFWLTLADGWSVDVGWLFGDGLSAWQQPAAAAAGEAAAAACRWRAEAAVGPCSRGCSWPLQQSRPLQQRGRQLHHPCSLLHLTPSPPPAPPPPPTPSTPSTAPLSPPPPYPPCRRAGGHLQTTLAHNPPRALNN